MIGAVTSNATFRDMLKKLSNEINVLHMGFLFRTRTRKKALFHRRFLRVFGHRHLPFSAVLGRGTLHDDASSKDLAIIFACKINQLVQNRVISMRVSMRQGTRGVGGPLHERGSQGAFVAIVAFGEGDIRPASAQSGGPLRG